MWAGPTHIKKKNKSLDLLVPIPWPLHTTSGFFTGSQTKVLSSGPYWATHKVSFSHVCYMARAYKTTVLLHLTIRPIITQYPIYSIGILSHLEKSMWAGPTHIKKIKLRQFGRLFVSCNVLQLFYRQ